MKNILPIAASCLLVGGGIGYLFGNQGVSEPVAPAFPDSSGGSLSSRTRSSGGGSVVSSSADKPSSYDEISALPGQTARLQALLEFYSGLSNEEFVAEAAKLDKLPFGERIVVGSILFGAWAEVSPFDAMEHANTQMGQAGMFVRPTILQSWAATDPKGAADYYAANKSQFATMRMFGGGRGGMSSGAASIAGEWAKQDPEGALAWAKSLDARDSSDAVSKALSQIATTDPLRASQLTAGLEGKALEEANISIAREWAGKDWSATEAWINGLPQDQKSDAMGAAIRSLASEDAKLAGSKALQMPEGEARDEAVGSVAQAMGREDPEAAVSWVMTNGSESAQRESMRDVMGNWASQDPTAARAWVSGQPEGEVRDAAASSYVMNDHSGNGSDQIAIAESISDERTRGWSVGVAAVRWMGQDKEAATAYIQSTEAISEDAKGRILERAEGRGGPGR
ncbi:hypothetical protein V2O64_04665 [Verrucomicrobiaceae bacterium 227]